MPEVGGTFIQAESELAAISLVAVLNGGLIQIIMATRVLYGLASHGLAWRPLARIHPITRTPLLGTAAVTIAVLMFALFFSLGGLASFTSFVALVVFAMVNASLWRLKRAEQPQPPFTVPVLRIGAPSLGEPLSAMVRLTGRRNRPINAVLQPCKRLLTI